MIQVLPGTSYEATLSGAPPDLVGVIGVQLVDGEGTVVEARSTAGIVESPPDSGVYTVTRNAPAAGGTFLVTWDTGGADPVFTVEELLVTGSIGTVPSVDEVALLLRTRTVKGTNTGLGADSGSGDFTTFDSTTRPTRNEVTSIIGTAYSAMLGRLRVPLITSQHESFKHVVMLYAAILIEVSFFRESVNEELLQIWRDEIAEVLEGIATKTEAEQPGADPTAFTFGTVRVGGVRYPTGDPEPDYMAGIDF
jgi:hypothetical protein